MMQNASSGVQIDQRSAKGNRNEKNIKSGWKLQISSIQKSFKNPCP